jgi:hypothetical protein
MHPLKIIQRADRFRIVLLLIVGEADFHLGIFGVGAERELVDYVLIVLNRGFVFFLREIELTLRVEILASWFLAETACARWQQSTSHQYQQKAFHRMRERLDNAVGHCNPAGKASSAEIAIDMYS